MHELKTLRDLMGLGNRPCPWGDSALVMIDCQNTYRRGIMQLTGVEEAIDEAKRLLDSARNAGTPIFHVMHDAGPGSPYDITADIGQIAEPVAPRAKVRGKDMDISGMPIALACSDQPTSQLFPAEYA
jgi:nicotinamidase-related amidase